MSLENLKIEWNGLMRLYFDNKFAINITHNPLQHDQTKNIEVDKHFNKENLKSRLVDQHTLCVYHMSTRKCLTEGLNSIVFQTIVSKLEMENIYSLARGRTWKNKSKTDLTILGQI